MALRRSRSTVLSSHAITAAACWLALAACKGKPLPDPRAECQLEISAACGPAGCPRFDQRAAELRAQVAAHHRAGSCLLRAEIGRCGPFRFVTSSDGFHGSTDYFDGAGRFVAGERWSDMNAYCDGSSFKAVVGQLPRCSVGESEVLCPRADGGT